MPAKVANDHGVLTGIGMMRMIMMAMVTTKIMDDSDDDDNDEDNDDEAGDDDVYDKPATCPQRAPCSAFIHSALPTAQHAAAAASDTAATTASARAGVDNFALMYFIVKSRGADDMTDDDESQTIGH